MINLATGVFEIFHVLECWFTFSHPLLSHHEDLVTVFFSVWSSWRLARRLTSTPLAPRRADPRTIRCTGASVLPQEFSKTHKHPKINRQTRQLAVLF